MRVHVLLQGHKTNVGDSVLRRAYLQNLSQLSDQISLWAGQTTGGYIAGLNPGPNTELRNNFIDWYARAIFDAARGQAHIALNAGQYTLTPRYLAHALPLILLSAITRATGGHIIWMGAAVPQPMVGRTWLFRVLSRLATTVYWRDSVTETYLPEGRRMPDWAFALGAPSPPMNDRPLLTVSLRGDRPAPSPEWLSALERAAHSLSLEIAFVTQVDEDNSRHHTLASALNAKHVSWQSESHLEQEAIVRAAYAKSAIIVSDRLHALIMGISEGAVPLAWTESETQKISRHLDHLGFDWAVLGGDEEPTQALREITHELYSDLQQSTLYYLAAARDSIKTLVSLMSADSPARS